MRYSIKVIFKDGHEETHAADGYASAHCVLQIITYNPPPMKMKVYSMLDIKEIEILEINL